MNHSEKTFRQLLWAYGLAIAMILLAAILRSAGAATYYVANSGDGGSNANNGLTTGTPWETCGYMMTQISGGDTVLFMGGTYAENNAGYNTSYTTLAITVSGTEGNETVFKACPGYNRPIFVGYGGYSQADSGTGIQVRIGTDYIILDSLEVRRSYTGISIWGECDYITVKNCRVDSTWAENNGGVVCPSSPQSYITIQNCSLSTNQRNFETWGQNCGGIQVYGLSHSIITGNVIWDQQYDSQGGIFLKTNDCDSNIISYNKIYNVYRGIHLYHDAVGNKIHHNTIYNAEDGIVINAPFTGNTMFENEIYNNTIYNCTSLGIAFKYISWHAIVDQSVYNNLIIANGNGYYGIGYYIGNISGADSLINLYSDYNVYYNYYDTSLVGRWWGGGLDVSYDIDELIAAKNIDSNSVVMDPVLADTANHDFSFTGSSPSEVTTLFKPGSEFEYPGANEPSSSTTKRARIRQ